jgi:DNA-directed RNA polymerase alpha subunit
MITKEQVLEAFNTIEKYKKQEEQQIKEIAAQSDKRSVTILGLNKRELNALSDNRIYTIGELLDLDRQHLKRFRNLGKKSIRNINEKLISFGINTQEFLTH